MKPTRIAVIGAGNRGQRYAELLAHAGARIVAVAEPNQARRRQMADDFGIDRVRCATGWETLDLGPDEVDGIVVATMDHQHVGAVAALAALNKPILLEKPIGESWSECRRLADALPADPPTILTGHVLRYAPYTVELRRLLAADVIGDLRGIHHLEPVGYWHFAHSFVRGNWASTPSAAPLIVSKACHDVDWIMHLIDSEVTAVSSFGSLAHFTAEHRPSGAADRCLDCTVECAYDGKTIYLAPARLGDFSHPVSTITEDLTEQGVLAALADGPYGRCAYLCDNNVVDSQVASLNFAGGQTASLVVSAFTEVRGRSTTLMGTKGEAQVTTDEIRTYSYATGHWTTHIVDGAAHGIDDGHGGGDQGIVAEFLREIAEPTDRGRSAFAEALRTHRVAFAIEAARATGRVVDPHDLERHDDPELQRTNR